MPTALLTRTAEITGKAAQLTDLLTAMLIGREVPALLACKPNGSDCTNNAECCSKYCLEDYDQGEEDFYCADRP